MFNIRNIKSGDINMSLFLNYISLIKTLNNNNNKKKLLSLQILRTLSKIRLTNRLSVMNAVSHFTITNQLVIVFLSYRREHRFTGEVTRLAVAAVVQSSSHVHLFVTSWSAAPQAHLSLTISWNLPRFMSIESVMPSNTQLFLSWRVRTCFLSSVCSTLPLSCSNKIVAALVSKLKKKKKLESKSKTQKAHDYSRDKGRFRGILFLFFP